MARKSDDLGGWGGPGPLAGHVNWTQPDGGNSGAGYPAAPSSQAHNSDSLDPAVAAGDAAFAADSPGAKGKS